MTRKKGQLSSSSQGRERKKALGGIGACRERKERGKEKKKESRPLPKKKKKRKGEAPLPFLLKKSNKTKGREKG